jgi:predicted metal-binding membrane protein
VSTSAFALDRATAATSVGLLAATTAAWVGLVRYEPPMGLPGFLLGWTLMMAAMMLPSIAPLALLHRGSRTLLALGYLAIWAAIGLLPFAAMQWDVSPALPLVLALAGAWELSPLKHACLRRCRNAAAFLMERYRSGSLRLGAEHALWCVGCCVGLMAVLVLAASMSLAWAAVIAGIVAVQKVLPLGEASARATGVSLLAAALVVAVT